jgi:hypothetical protein
MCNDIVLNADNNVSVRTPFNYAEWSAPFYQSPWELKKCLDAFDVLNKPIKRIVFLSDCGNSLTRISQAVENRLFDIDSGEWEGFHAYLYAELQRDEDSDDPVIIVFENGERLEIFFPAESTVRLSMNSIPYFIAATNSVDPNVLFSPCIGESIVSAEVKIKSHYDGFAFDYEDSLKNRNEFIDRVQFKLSNGLYLSFSTHIDFSNIALIDSPDNKQPVKIFFNDLRQGLKLANAVDDSVMEYINNAEKIDTALGIIQEKPVDFFRLNRLLYEWNPPSLALSELANVLVDSCFCEFADASDRGDVVEERLTSFYLPEILQLLLSYGMNPNESFGFDNVMSKLQWIDYKDCAIRSLKLLLKNGGNPNLSVDGESIFDHINTKVSHDRYEDKALVKLWLLLMSYGGCWKNAEIPLTMSEGYSIEIFKNYDEYTYTIELLEQIPNCYGCWIMHIFEKCSGIEVAKYA